MSQALVQFVIKLDSYDIALPSYFCVHIFVQLTVKKWLCNRRAFDPWRRYTGVRHGQMTLPKSLRPGWGSSCRAVLSSTVAVLTAEWLLTCLALIVSDLPVLTVLRHHFLWFASAVINLFWLFDWLLDCLSNKSTVIYYILDVYVRHRCDFEQTFNYKYATKRSTAICQIWFDLIRSPNFEWR